MKIKIPEHPRILVTRTDRIGDLVLTTPVFKVLREKFPGAWIATLIFLQHREIVEGNPFLNEIILYDKKGSEKSLWGQFCFSQMLRKKKFDIVIHCHSTNRVHLSGWLAGIPVRIGYDRRAPWALTHVHPYNKREGKKQEAEYLFELLQDIDVFATEKPETFFPVCSRSMASLEKWVTAYQVSRKMPWIVLNLSASDKTKMWPVEKFAELATWIGKNHACTFFVTGTRQDRPLVEKLKKNTNMPVVDVTGKLTLGMLGALLKRSALLVSNDSGPVHIAVAVKTPVVSIFGRQKPGL